MNFAFNDRFHNSKRKRVTRLCYCFRPRTKRALSQHLNSKFEIRMDSNRWMTHVLDGRGKEDRWTTGT